MTSILKNPNNEAWKLTKAILSVQSFYLKKINNKKKLYFEEEIAENKNNLKETW